MNSERSAKTEERLIEGGVVLLALLCWPDLENPFSTPKTWLLAGLGLTAAALALTRKPATPWQDRSWPWPTWLAALAASAATAGHPSFDALLLVLAPLPLYWALRRMQIPVDRLVRAILFASLLESVIALLQYAHLDPLRLLGWHPEAFPNRRMLVYGTLGNPDFVAAWLCATLPLYAGVVKRKRAVFWGIAVALHLGAILATGSRIFILTLPVAALVLALRRHPWAKWCYFGLPVAAALLLFSHTRPLGVTVQGRLYAARVAASHLSHVPVVGYGPGTFAREFTNWQAEWLPQHPQDSERRFAGLFDHAHNDYLEFFVEYGPAGLCAFLALCGWLMARAWRVSDAGVWAALASLLAIACVDFPFHRPAEWGLFWLLLVSLGTNRQHKEDR